MKVIPSIKLMALTLLLVACSPTPIKEKEDQIGGISSSQSRSKRRTKEDVPSQEGSVPETKGDWPDDGSEEQVATASEGQETSPSETPTSPSSDLVFNGLYYSLQGKYGEVIVVNKKHPLSANYAPGEDPQASQAFWNLVGDMQAQGYDVAQAYSGFRSYETQSNLYNNYVTRDGQTQADRYSARPGYSEHQTGLAFDLLDSSGSLLSEATATNWLYHHAHDYGFVVRYLPGKESITGYMAEEWHIRYIGPEAADIYRSGLTLEEYYGFEGGGYSH